MKGFHKTRIHTCPCQENLSVNKRSNDLRKYANTGAAIRAEWMSWPIPGESSEQTWANPSLELALNFQNVPGPNLFKRLSHRSNLGHEQASCAALGFNEYNGGLIANMHCGQLSAYRSGVALDTFSFQVPALFTKTSVAACWSSWPGFALGAYSFS